MNTFGNLESRVITSQRIAQTTSMNLEASLLHAKDGGILCDTEFDQAMYLIKSFKFIPETSGPITGALHGG